LNNKSTEQEGNGKPARLTSLFLARREYSTLLFKRLKLFKPFKQLDRGGWPAFRSLGIGRRRPRE